MIFSLCITEALNQCIKGVSTGQGKSALLMCSNLVKSKNLKQQQNQGNVGMNMDYHLRLNRDCSESLN